MLVEQIKSEKKIIGIIANAVTGDSEVTSYEVQDGGQIEIRTSTATIRLKVELASGSNKEAS